MIGFDPDRPVTIVRTTARNWTNDAAAAKLAKLWREHISGRIYDVPDFGPVTASRADVDHCISSFDKSVSRAAHFAVLASAPELLANAVLVETHGDDKKVPGVRRIHRLFAAAALSHHVYTVKFTIKEHADGVMAFDGVMRLYDYHVPKKLPALTQAVDSSGGHLPGVSRGTNSPTLGGAPIPDRISLRELLAGLKDQSGTPYLAEPAAG